MKKLIVFLLITAGISGYGQIQITKDDMPKADNHYYMSTNVTAGLVDYTKTGADYKWDFSKLFQLSSRTDSFIAVSSTPFIYRILFFGATVVMKQPSMTFIPGFSLTDVYSYYKTSSSAYSMMGFGAKLNGIPVPFKFEDYDEVYKLPVKYANVDSSNSSYAFSIDNLGYLSQEKKRKNYADGWGTLITPTDTFEVLRVKSVIVEKDSINIDSLGFAIPAITRNYTEYKWLAKGYPVPVLQITKEGFITNVAYYVCSKAPISPVKGTNTASVNQIIWNWKPVSGAKGYKWNTENNYETATDVGNKTSRTENGLKCDTTYTRYIWAYNPCGNSASVKLTQSTAPLDAPTAGSNSPQCTGDTLKLSAASSQQSATYSWTGPDGFSSDEQNPEIINVTSAGAGSYNVIATAFGCSSIAATTEVVINPCGTISGLVSYDNSKKTPLKNINLDLTNPEGNIIDTTTTDESGNYVFLNVKTGNYFINASSQGINGGIDPVDALLANKIYIGTTELTDSLKILAADVNIDNKINSLDALLINLFYIGSVTSFKAGTWIFENDSIKFNGENITHNIKGLCFGDVNGSFIPTSK